MLLAMLVAVPLLLLATPASADNKSNEERDNYSLYQLASNASTYFSQENSPEGESDPQDRMTADWRTVTGRPATGGDMLGYADPEFSIGDIIGWLFAEISGSSQTVGYGTLKAADGDGADIYAGMLDYAHFGATNADLGLDTMSSGIGGQIVGMIGGSVIWVLYALALAVGTLFFLIIQLLKIINPFLWFYQAVSAVNETFGNGMVCATDGFGAETCHTGGGALAGLQNWINDWYGMLTSIAWEALIPLFIAITIIGLTLFKKMDRGSAIKKLLVRIVFIGVGLPLIGSMYTGVLDKFDDSLLGQHSGPTRVVLSTYVDFEAWAMNDRLGIPDEADIAWDNGQASSNALMSVRTTALAINKQSHGSIYAGITVGKKATDAEAAWREGTTRVDRTATDDANAVFRTFGIIGNYITGTEVAASDFESGIKSSITKLDVATDDKKEWFIDKKGYGDLDAFGEDTDYGPTNHPVLSVGNGGLTSSTPGGNATTYTTPGTKSGCGFTVWTNNAPASCNMSALSMYNYLNTGFGTDSLTMYSSNNATSGFTRENHMAVSQVGTGPASFMYWQNAATVLGSIALLGFWYAIGMLVGAVKRTFSLVAAVPFATLGAIGAISKVIVYSTALILEVLVTLFIYQFVSEFLISIPDVIAGPMSNLMAPGGLFGSAVLGGIVVVILTLVSSLLILGVTFGLLRARKVVLQAMDEIVTKLVDKFLDTNTAPMPNKGGILPALASGAGAGAGMALGNKLASGLGNDNVGRKTPRTSKTGETAPSMNAGGTNGDPKTLTAAAERLNLGPGGDSGGGVLTALGPHGGGPAGGTPGHNLPGGAGDAKTLPSSDVPEGRPLLLAGDAGQSTQSDKETAQALNRRGGLSRLGYHSAPALEPGKTSAGQQRFRSGPAPGAQGPDGMSGGQPSNSDQPAPPRPHPPAPPGGAGSTRTRRPVQSTGGGNPTRDNFEDRPTGSRTSASTGGSAATRPIGLAAKRPLGIPRDPSQPSSAPRLAKSRPRVVPQPDTVLRKGNQQKPEE
ncbi:rhomboid family intramembrane serine protease [Amycolatopsis sp. TNS106]|uniref:rhomboid family intramembrane serine protease n=1 Tax=Amycolatopsis sp. TNS106 TaxID=2861750 RepID=UPI001C59B68C|nr:rhomboid family intramembrane serine protease [Amycolatopsis sp. TNS106]